MNLHTQLLLSDRLYYSLMPFFPINDRSKTLILRGLLSTGQVRIVQDEALEWEIIKSSEIQLWFTQKTNPELCPFKTGGATDLRIPFTQAIRGFSTLYP